MPWRVSLDYSYNDANQLIQGSTRQTEREPWTPPNGNTGELGVRNRYEKLVTGLSYDHSQILTTGVSIPYVRNQRWEDHHHYSHYESAGIGDVTVFGKYWLKREKDALNTYVDLALSLPTGKSDETFNYIPQGKTAVTTAYRAAYIQPGYGQLVPIIALGFEKPAGTGTSMFGRAQYSDPQWTNDVGYRSQSNLMTNLGMGHSFGKYGVSGQFNYLYAKFRKDSRNGVDVGNTGGEWIDFQPGAFYSPDGGITTITASVPIGLYYYVNSIQTYAPWSLNIGVSRRF